MSERPTLREWSRRYFATPPGWRFHALCVPPALARLWFASYPGFPLVALYVDVLLAALAGWWLLRLAIHLTLRGQERRRFAVAPICGLMVAALLATNAPLQTRWRFSEGEFNHVVNSLEGLQRAPNADVDRPPVDVPHRIGHYDISSAYRVPGGLIFYESHGALFDDAGFGWFPNGPDADALNNGSFENPQFTHRHGPWYSWTASW